MEQHYKERQVALKIVMITGIVVGLTGSIAMLGVIVEIAELFDAIIINLMSNFALAYIIKYHKQLKEL